MPNIRAGDRLSLGLDVGKVLTVTADPQSSGLVRTYPSNTQGIQSNGQHMVASGGTLSFGPYLVPAKFSIEVATGQLAYAFGDDPPDDAAEKPLTIDASGGYRAAGQLVGHKGASAVYSPELFGTPGTDSTELIQAAIDAASAAYNATTGCRAKVVFPATVYGIAGLLLKPNVILDFGQAYFKKLADGSSVATNSMLRTVDSLVGGSTYYGNYDNIDIIGGTFDSNGFTCPAQIIRLENVRDLRIEKTKVVHSAACQSWAFQIGGKRIECVDLKVLGGTALYQDGIHLTHGDQITVRGGYVESGDDAIACGIDASGTETWDDEALTNVTIDGVRVKSEKGSIKVYYGLNTTTGMPFSGANRGKIDGVVMRGLVGSLGRLANGPIYIVDTQTITFTGVPAGSATSATLTANWTGQTGVYNVLFANGNMRAVTLTNGATTATWTGGLSSGAGSAVASCGDASRIKNVQIVDFDLTGGSASNDGVNSWGIYLRYASKIKLAGTLKIVDTASGNRFGLGSIMQGYGLDISIKCAQLPAGPGLSLFDCKGVNIHDGEFFGNGGSGRGTIEVTGSQNVKIHHNDITDIPTSGTGVLVQSVGSGNLPNTLIVSDNWFTKASGASTTRAYGQQSGSAGFVKSLNFHDNDLRGDTNATSVDQAWNGTGVTPDQMHVWGNRGNVNFAPANATPYGAQVVTFGTSLTFALIFGSNITLSTAMTSNITINAPTDARLGQRLKIALVQDGTGGRTVTWNSVFKFVCAAWVDAVVTTDANKQTSIVFEYDGTNWIQQTPNRWV